MALWNDLTTKDKTGDTTGGAIPFSPVYRGFVQGGYVVNATADPGVKNGITVCFAPVESVTEAVWNTRGQQRQRGRRS